MYTICIVAAAPIDFTLIKFDSRCIEKVCVAVPASQVAELTMEARMGVAATSTMSSGRSPQHVRASYAAMAESTAAYAAGRAKDTHLSMSARAASGDAHFQRVFGQQGSPPIPSQPKHKAVDDFSL